MEEAREFATLSEVSQNTSKIKITESNFLKAGDVIIFDGTCFEFPRGLIKTVNAEDMVHVNRPSKGSIKTVNTNVFSRAFNGGVEIAIVRQISEFFRVGNTGKSRVFVKFENGRYFRGKTTAETVFKLNYILLDKRQSSDVSKP